MSSKRVGKKPRPPPALPKQRSGNGREGGQSLKEMLNNINTDKETINPLNQVLGLLKGGSFELGNSKQTEAQKDLIKQGLAGKYEQMDEALDIVVRENRSNFTASIKCFSESDRNITDSQERLDRLRTSILRCKQQLQTRKETIAQLWKSHIEHVEMLRLLELVEDVVKVPEQVRLFSSEKQYLIATKLIAETRHSLDSDLVDFQALSGLRVQLGSLSKNLYDTIFEELLDHLFLKREIEGKSLFQTDNSKGKENAERVDEETTNLSSRILERLAKENLRTPRIERLVGVMIEPYTSSEGYIGLLVESLSLLGYLKEAFSNLNQRLGKELAQVTVCVENYIQKSAPSQISATSNLIKQPVSGKKPTKKSGVNVKPKILLGFLQELFELYKRILNQNSFVLKVIESGKVFREAQGDTMGFSMQIIWVGIQKELENILNDYFGNATDRPSKSRNVDDLDPVSLYNSFTGKEVAQPLFKFSASNFSGVTTDKNEVNATADSRVFVCPAVPNNFPICYQITMAFLSQIQTLFFPTKNENTVESKTHLGSFLSKHGKTTFLKHVRSEMCTKLNRVTEDFDSFNVTEQATSSKLAGIGLVKSVVVVQNIVHDLLALCLKIPTYVGDICQVIIEILKRYIGTCSSLFSGVINKGGSGRIISNEWLCNAELEKIILQYPGWVALKQYKASAQGKSPQQVFELNKDEEKKTRSLYQMQRIIEESKVNDLYSSNLRVLSSIESFSTLVNLSQSLEWLASEFDKKSIEKYLGSNTSPSARENLLNTFKQIGKLSDKCLISLKLEIRSQSYYYLFRALRSNYFLEEDPVQPEQNVSKLNETLCAIEETCNNGMTSVNKRYVFSDLGLLISGVLISRIELIKSINSNGVVQMCRNIYALKQNINNLGAGGTDLDRALKYYELLNRPIKDIANERLKNPKTFFSKEECTKLLKLMATSSETNAENLSNEISRLH